MTHRVPKKSETFRIRDVDKRQAYNHEEYIRDALESIVTQQTDFPFELLVNDDA